MAVSANMFDGTVATVAASGTSVEPTLEIPDNCHTVVIFNPDSTNTVYASLGTAGGAIPSNAAAVVPATSSLSLVVGTLSQRASSGANLIFDTSAGSITVQIIYVNGTAI